MTIEVYLIAIGSQAFATHFLMDRSIMSIAQRFVAGEGDTYPNEPATPLTNAASLASPHETDTTNLRWISFRAAFRAERIHALPLRARSVLAALARTVSADDPLAAIFARRELLIDRAMLSERTFFRALDDLEAAGLITRPEQRRYKNAGLFGRAYLHLTEAAALTLGLIQAEMPLQQPVDVHQTGKQVSPPANLADGAIYKEVNPQPNQERQPGALPQDLQRLLELGFGKYFIFKLMRIASKNGKRLSDVVEASWTHLKAASKPICYLQALLAKPIDFAHIARVNRATSQTEDLKSREQTAQRQLLDEVRGKTYSDAQGAIVTFDADGSHAAVRTPTEIVPRFATGTVLMTLVNAVQCGQLSLHRDLGDASQPRNPNKLRHPERRSSTDTKRHVDALRGLLQGALSRHAAVSRDSESARVNQTC
ncbi:Replication protein O [Robbsia andropogonis]|uniref:Replication protein O n=1 Tax=Robbsia andropogonis TaxID=28092 RepID=UPI002A6B0712|nr:Replication protein O [Robbsia andropogonis]